MRTFGEFIKNNRRIIIGVSLGLATGILFLTIGFFATLLLWVCIIAGIVIAVDCALRRTILSLLSRIVPKIFK